MRIDGRNNNDLRETIIETNTMQFCDGSAVISTGYTKVLCTASIETRVPPFLIGQNKGWITAEYSMLPGSTTPRSSRGNQKKGRSQEIQRLIGRSLRASFDLSLIGERTITVDCDVLQADGGTRTAAITGGYVALRIAVDNMIKQGLISGDIPPANIAATSVGIINGSVLLDLCYEEDSKADADFNIVKTRDNMFIEIQGSAEGKKFSRESIDNVLDTASQGITELFEIQDEALKASEDTI